MKACLVCLWFERLNTVQEKPCTGRCTILLSWHFVLRPDVQFYESGVVQVAVYKLSEAGQAIDGGDFSKATTVLAQQNADWIRDVQAALNKVGFSRYWLFISGTLFIIDSFFFFPGELECGWESCGRQFPFSSVHASRCRYFHLCCDLYFV